MSERGQQLWVVAGPNGAGKTTLVSDRIARRIPVVNPDAIALELPSIEGSPDERRAGELAIERRNALLKAGESFAIETTLSGNSTLRLMTAARLIGCKNTLVFVGVASARLSMSRVADRVEEGGHAVPVSAVLRRYPNVLARLPKAMALADRTFILDNSGSRRRLLMVEEAGRVRFVTRDPPAWFIAALPEVARPPG